MPSLRPGAPGRGPPACSSAQADLGSLELWISSSVETSVPAHAPPPVGALAITAGTFPLPVSCLSTLGSLGGVGSSTGFHGAAAQAPSSGSDLPAVSCWPGQSQALGFRVGPVRSRLPFQIPAPQQAVPGSQERPRAQVTEQGLCALLPGAPAETYSSAGRTSDPEAGTEPPKEEPLVRFSLAKPPAAPLSCWLETRSLCRFEFVFVFHPLSSLKTIIWLVFFFF